MVLSRTREDFRDTFPSLAIVITIHSISLLTTLILGITLFLLQTPLIYYLYALFLTGPIYAVNLYYLTTYIDVVEGKMNSLLRNLNHGRQKTTDSSNTSPQRQSKSVANNYLLSKVHSETSKNIIDRKLFYFSMFTPIWPLTFYYTLYKISDFLSTYEDLLDNHSFFDPENAHPKGRRTLDNVNLFETSLKHKVFYSSFALVSVIGFAMTFYMISIGFFALFWVVLLHHRLSGYIEESKKNSTFFNTNKGRGNITPSLIIAFLGFGATSGFIAMFSNTFYLSLSSPIGLVSPTVLLFFLVTVIAPVVEEPIKVSGFFLIDKEKSKHISLFCWTFFGLIAGFGFALIENYIYFQTFFLEFSTMDSLYLLLVRFSFPVHMIGSALAGLGIGLWRKKKNLIYLVVFVLLAILVHGSYNFIVTLGGV